MRAHLLHRAQASNISAVPPPAHSSDYSTDMAKAAESILYRSPLPSPSGHQVYILDSAALPDTSEVDYDSLLPYVLARLPDEDDLVGGTAYEIIFFAGGAAEGATSTKKSRPGWGWFIQAYHVLSRAMRKRIQKLYIVHERTWVRVLAEMFSTVVSPKFRRKIVHASSLSALALHIPIENLLIPPSAYLQDRRWTPTIFSPYASGPRAFQTRQPFPTGRSGRRLPRVLRETTSFLMLADNLHTEGLFRIPAHMRLKDILREAYDRGQKFIIWKERDVALPLPPYPGAVDLEATIRQTDQTSAYGVHIAAGLIKAWYADLRTPIVPPGSYSDLQRLVSGLPNPPSVQALADLFNPASTWSPLPVISRTILVRHLLPLLHAVARHSADNKMTPVNLATCFAPAMVRGPDQMADVKMSALVAGLLTQGITAWDDKDGQGTGLREACGLHADDFLRDIAPPTDMAEYEDPLEKAMISVSSNVDQGGDRQQEGIVLVDGKGSGKEKEANIPPPLPPRNSQTPLAPRVVVGDAVVRPSMSGPVSPVVASPVRRKPVGSASASASPVSPIEGGGSM
ncbi:Rho GTPase activation protein [Trichodelitschia bisporula]|uniref:Rho GTPase activation protein n=1 Tax=Trichodelitschia bisporula TaxID=703511 RepID=A0A6G1HSQ1_9PEZI|nr:Rho GTPase activation protein [Trichodelitschia bisporula]